MEKEYQCGKIVTFYNYIILTRLIAPTPYSRKGIHFMMKIVPRFWRKNE
jgi:hypothetical protein